MCEPVTICNRFMIALAGPHQGLFLAAPRGSKSNLAPPKKSLLDFNHLSNSGTLCNNL